MAGNIRLEIVTPEKVVVSEEVQIVVAPGTLGEFGVLIGHTPFMTTLNTGALRYTDANGTDRAVFISSGFAEALPNKVTVLAETAERRRDIDLERAKTALELARQRLAAEKADNIEYVRVKAAIQRALHRIKLAETRRS